MDFFEWIEIKRGLPQGAVLGALFFILYIIDIQKCISHESTLVQSADDCIIFDSYLTSNDALNQLQYNIPELTKFFAENQLNLNSSKSEFFFLSKIDKKNVIADRSFSNNQYGLK